MRRQHGTARRMGERERGRGQIRKEGARTAREEGMGQSTEREEREERSKREMRERRERGEGGEEGKDEEEQGGFSIP